MTIAKRQRGEEYFANGMFENMRIRFSTEKGFPLDWNIDFKWFDTDAHGLHERIAERTDCPSFTDFMFLFKRSFAMLLRTIRERPEKNQSYSISFRNRNLRYIMTYQGERNGEQGWFFKTIRKSSWNIHEEDRQFIVVI